jgi:hypothetical protein
MNRIILLFFILTPTLVFSQVEISWETLSDVEFSDVYMEEVDEYFLYPHFGPSVRQLEGQEVMLTGFILALDPSDNYYVLSKGPFASCFFCGAGGPETVVELKLKSNKDYFVMDQMVTIKGILKLNPDDIYQCNYIFEQAEVTRK